MELDSAWNWTEPNWGPQRPSENEVNRRLDKPEWVEHNAGSAFLTAPTAFVKLREGGLEKADWPRGTPACPASFFSEACHG